MHGSIWVGKHPDNSKYSKYFVKGSRNLPTRNSGYQVDLTVQGDNAKLFLPPTSGNRFKQNHDGHKLSTFLTVCDHSTDSVYPQFPE